MLTESRLIEQNRALREENEELRETIRQLRLEFRAEDEPLPRGLPKLTRSEASVLRILLRRNGLVSRRAVYEAIYGGSETRDEKMVDVWVCKLRQKLEGSGIEILTEYGRGYRIDRGDEASGDAQLVSEAIAA